MNRDMNHCCVCVRVCFWRWLKSKGSGNLKRKKKGWPAVLQEDGGEEDAGSTRYAARTDAIRPLNHQVRTTPLLAAGTRSPPTPPTPPKSTNEVTGKSCTFSLGSPPPPPLQLAFDLAALVSPRRAAAVPKHGCHQRSVLWSGAQGKNLEPGAAESVSPSLSVCLVAQRPRAFDVASDYIFVSPSSPSSPLSASPPLCFFLYTSAAGGERVLLFLYHL